MPTQSPSRTYSVRTSLVRSVAPTIASWSSSVALDTRPSGSTTSLTPEIAAPPESPRPARQPRHASEPAHRHEGNALNHRHEVVLFVHRPAPPGTGRVVKEGRVVAAVRSSGQPLHVQPADQHRGVALPH